MKFWGKLFGLFALGGSLLVFAIANTWNLTTPILQNDNAAVVIAGKDGSMGSGFVINEAGCILTAAHVIRTTDEFMVDRPGSVSRIKYRIVAVGANRLDAAVLCPISFVTPKSIATLSLEKVAIGNQIHLFGFYVNTGHFVKKSGAIVDFITEDMDLYNYKAAPRFELNDGEYIRTGFSGSPIISEHGVIGIVAICFHTFDEQKLWLCAGPNMTDVVQFLHDNGIKFYATSGH